MSKKITIDFGDEDGMYFDGQRGDFCLISKSKKILESIYECRELFFDDIEDNGYKNRYIGFYCDNYIKQIRQLFSIIEGKNGLNIPKAERLGICRTNKSGVIILQPNWWGKTKNHFRLALLTIFLRCAFNFNLKDNKTTVSILHLHPYLWKNKEKIKEFFSGKTILRQLVKQDDYYYDYDWIYPANYINELSYNPNLKLVAPRKIKNKVK